MGSIGVLSGPDFEGDSIYHDTGGGVKARRDTYDPTYDDGHAHINTA